MVINIQFQRDFPAEMSAFKVNASLLILIRIVWLYGLICQSGGEATYVDKTFIQMFFGGLCITR